MSTPQQARASRENKPRGAHSANDPFDEKALAAKNLVEAPLPLIEIVAAVRHQHAAITVVSSVADQKDLQTKRTESRMTEDTDNGSCEAQLRTLRRTKRGTSEKTARSVMFPAGQPGDSARMRPNRRSQTITNNKQCFALYCDQYLRSKGTTVVTMRRVRRRGTQTYLHS
jgi:hypothetical protein